MTIPGPQRAADERKGLPMYSVPNPTLIVLERLAAEVVPILRGIHAELKRANDQRDAWAGQVLDVLRDAKDPE